MAKLKGGLAAIGVFGALMGAQTLTIRIGDGADGNAFFGLRKKIQEESMGFIRCFGIEEL